MDISKLCSFMPGICLSVKTNSMEQGYWESLSPILVNNFPEFCGSKEFSTILIGK
jgi:hypothetical protein